MAFEPVGVSKCVPAAKQAPSTPSTPHFAGSSWAAGDTLAS